MLAAGAPLWSLPHRRRTLTGSAARPGLVARCSIFIAANGDSKSEISNNASRTNGGHDARLSAVLAVQQLLQTVDQVQQLVADVRQAYNRSASELVAAKEQFEQAWDRAQVEKEELDKQAAADKAALARLTEEVQDLQWGMHERTEMVQGLEKRLAEANAEKERALAEMGRVKAQPPQLNSANTQLEGKELKTGSSLPISQEGGSLGCDCQGLPGGRPCDGRCGDTYVGSGFARFISSQRECVDLDGSILPQEVFKLHTLIRKLQQQRQQWQQATQGWQQSKAALRSRAEAAERNVASAIKDLTWAKQDAAAKQEWADKRVKQLQAQWEELVKRNTTTEARVTQLTTEVSAMQTGRAQLVEQVEVLEEILATRAAQEEKTAAELRLSKDAIQAAEAHLAQLGIIGLDSSSGGVKAYLRPYTGQRRAGGSFPVGFGSVEQRECLDQLSIATEQLAAVLVQGSNLQYPPVQHLVNAVKGSLEGTAALVRSWERDSCAAALHHHVLNTALDIAQQQVDWYQHRAGAELANYLACLTSCPEAGRTELHAVLQQLQQAKSSTLFLVAQQQAPSHPATRKVAEYVDCIRQYMQGQLEQQLGLTYPYHQACVAWQPQLVAVAAAMTRVNLLLASLQSSCPGLQLVSRLEEWGAQEGQQACEAPVRQLLGKVEASRPLFLVRPGLVCAAAGGGRQVLVRQQAVALVPDPAWLEQLQQEAEAEAAAARKQQEAEAARKEQEEWVRLVADEEHRHKLEEQRLLKGTSEEREKKLLTEEADINSHKVADDPGRPLDSSCSKSRGALPPMGCEADIEKAEHLATHADCSTDSGIHQAPHRQRDDAGCAATPPAAQDLSPGGHAGCPGPDTQDTRLDSSSQGGVGQCSDADSQAGCGQGHENAFVPHHQTSAPNQGHLVAAATSLAPCKVIGGQGDTNALDQQLAVAVAVNVPSRETSRLQGGAASTSRLAAEEHGARQHEGVETAATQPPPCSLTESGAVQQPLTHLPQPPPPPATQQQPQPQQPQLPPLQQQSSPDFSPPHALQPPGSYPSNGSGHQAPDSRAQGLVPDGGREGQLEAAASRGYGGQAAATGTEGSASGEAGGITLMEVEEQMETDAAGDKMME